MDEDRKKAIVEFQMPSCQKEMQSFLGAALFFKSFVPNYSGIAAELNNCLLPILVHLALSVARSPCIQKT